MKIKIFQARYKNPTDYIIKEIVYDILWLKQNGNFTLTRQTINQENFVTLSIQASKSGALNLIKQILRDTHLVAKGNFNISLSPIGSQSR